MSNRNTVNQKYKAYQKNPTVQSQNKVRYTQRPDEKPKSICNWITDQIWATHLIIKQQPSYELIINLVWSNKSFFNKAIIYYCQVESCQRIVKNLNKWDPGLGKLIANADVISETIRSSQQRVFVVYTDANFNKLISTFFMPNQINLVINLDLHYNQQVKAPLSSYYMQRIKKYHLQQQKQQYRGVVINVIDLKFKQMQKQLYNFLKTKKLGLSDMKSHQTNLSNFFPKKQTSKTQNINSEINSLQSSSSQKSEKSKKQQVKYQTLTNWATHIILWQKSQKEAIKTTVNKIITDNITSIKSCLIYAKNSSITKQLYEGLTVNQQCHCQILDKQFDAHTFMKYTYEKYYKYLIVNCQSFDITYYKSVIPNNVNLIINTQPCFYTDYYKSRIQKTIKVGEEVIKGYIVNIVSSSKQENDIKECINQCSKTSKLIISNSAIDGYSLNTIQVQQQWQNGNQKESREQSFAAKNPTPASTVSEKNSENISKNETKKYRQKQEQPKNIHKSISQQSNSSLSMQQYTRDHSRQKQEIVVKKIEGVSTELKEFRQLYQQNYNRLTQYLLSKQKDDALKQQIINLKDKLEKTEKQNKQLIQKLNLREKENQDIKNEVQKYKQKLRLIQSSKQKISAQIDNLKQNDTKIKNYVKQVIKQREQQNRKHQLQNAKIDNRKVAKECNDMDQNIDKYIQNTTSLQLVQKVVRPPSEQFNKLNKLLADALKIKFNVQDGIPITQIHQIKAVTQCLLNMSNSQSQNINLFLIGELINRLIQNNDATKNYYNQKNEQVTNKSQKSIKDLTQSKKQLKQTIQKLKENHQLKLQEITQKHQKQLSNQKNNYEQVLKSYEINLNCLQNTKIRAEKFENQVNKTTRALLNTETNITLDNFTTSLHDFQHNLEEKRRRELFLIDSEIYQNMKNVEDKNFIYYNVEQTVNRKIIRTKTLFTASCADDFYENWKSKILYKPYILFVMTLESGVQVGGFSENPFSDKEQWTQGKGFLMGITKKKVYHIKKSKQGKVAQYDRFTMTFGGNQFVIKPNMKYNVLMGRSYPCFETGGDRAIDFTGEDADEAGYVSVEVHQMVLEGKEY